MKFSAALLIPGLALLAMSRADTSVIIRISRTDDATDAPMETEEGNDDDATSDENRVAQSCTRSGNFVDEWYNDSWKNGPYQCLQTGNDIPWTMLNAYRAGGKEGIHWKYVVSGDDGGCLSNWQYYEKDGKTLKATIERSTTWGTTRRWCALPVYRSGGIEGKQWANCDSCSHRKLASAGINATTTDN